MVVTIGNCSFSLCHSLIIHVPSYSLYYLAKCKINEIELGSVIGF